MRRYFASQKIYTLLPRMAAVIGVVVFAFSSHGYFIPAVQAADSVISQKEDQLDTINDKIKTYRKMIDIKQKQQSYLTDQIQSLSTQTTKLQSDITENQNKITSLDDQIRILESRISEKNELIADQKKLLAELVRTYYDQQKNIDATSSIFAFMPVAEAQALTKQNDWTVDIGSRVTDIVESLDTLRTSLLEEQGTLQGNRTEIDNARLQLQQQNDYLESAKQSKQQLATQAQLAEKQYSSIVSDLQKQRDAMEQEIEALESAKVDQLDVSKLPGFGKAIFIYPVKNPRQSQGYGKTSFAKKAYASGFHNGLDYAAATGTPIYAAASGTVIGVGNCGRYAYGKWVAVDHGNGLVTLYGHLSKQSVSKGDKVSQGEKIGLMGSTGYSTGTHVHFSVFAKSSFDVVESKSVSGIMIPTGATVNPKSYLP